MNAIVVLHPSYIARCSLRELVETFLRAGLSPSNVRAKSGNHYLILEGRAARAKEA